MIPLPTIFKAGSSKYSGPFDFNQIAREGDVALYRKSKLYKKMKGRLKPFEFEAYEVVVIQKMDEHKWPNGDVTPAHEHMPGGEQWGINGWSCQTLERAWEKFREVLRDHPLEE